ncbi:MAG: ZIP family metal transporter [Vulcanimicrobiota bacterium]
MTDPQLTIIFWSLVTGIISALATGLGAIPVALIKDKAEQAKSWASGLAAGMMIWASLEAIIVEALAMHLTSGLFGVIAGFVFVYGLDQWLPEGEQKPAGFKLWLVMLIHSFPEGLAIGVGFATGDLAFGILLALVISVHNIPEGLAISLAMRGDGASMAKCFWFSVLSSAPQPLVAVPAAILVSWAQLLIPPGLGFAGGAMLYVAGKDLAPKAYKELGFGKALTALVLGAVLMALLTRMLGG